jgi:hypothetical protein
LDNLVGWDSLDSQKRGYVIAEHKTEHFIRRFSVQAFTLYTIDMGENQVDRFLREMVKGFALWDNVTEKGMVFLHLWFLA